MARIVPAKPIAWEQAILSLEQGLDDDFVILQRGLPSGGILILHPEKGVCAVFVVPGVQTWDADGEEWSGLTPAAYIKAVVETLGTLASSFIPSVVRYFPDTPAPSDPGRRQDIVFRETTNDLPGVVLKSMTGAPHVSIDVIDALIDHSTPGASPYLRGQVTEAQQRWRSERRVPSSPTENNERPHPSGQPEVAQPIAAPAMNPPATSAPATPLNRAGPKSKHLAEDDDILMLLRQSAETAIRGLPIYVSGIIISSEELVRPNFLLPALLVAAAEDWGPVVASREGKGGFHLRLRTDPDAILGYDLVALEPSATLLLVLPVVHRIRKAIKWAKKSDGTGEEEIVGMDDTVHLFGRWLDKHKLNADGVGDVDMRIVLQG